jgi:hypothetical protein
MQDIGLSWKFFLVLMCCYSLIYVFNPLHFFCTIKEDENPDVLLRSDGGPETQVGQLRGYVTWHTFVRGIGL